MLKGFSHYPEIYWVGKAYYEHDHSDSYFASYTNALEELTKPFARKCLFTYTEKFKHYPEYKCKISITWENHSPPILTMAMPKNWEYSGLIRHSMLRRMDSGTVNRIAAKYYKGQDMPCPVEVRGTSLGLYKVLGSTIVFAFGICLALATLLCEILRNYFTRKITPCYGSADQEPETTFEEAIRLVCIAWGPKTSSYMQSFEEELKDVIIYSLKNYSINCD